MICKVIEGEEEISCPPCHEWNACKTQQRHNHFHFLHKVFSEHNKILIFWTANVFLAHAPLFHHIFVTFVNNTWRGILFSSRNQIFADLKSWWKSAAPFKNPQHKKACHHRVTVSLWCIFIFVYSIFFFLSLSSCLIECSTKNSHSAHWLCAWSSGAGTCSGDFSNFLLDICWLW